ncbi:zinc-finger domain of monoamine-oxidase A repressor R1 [Actinidia rufa]|uniref:Zinc-finger domain of monoamine-oxidase A repressor R1 n=1 Tax=Actinidia rufa TaxID=165716 RepID=A0A7J0F7N8_9ERIC|nr:zinc-finger domain of monoamine-oxidase A repressor R1 [Actinidia rufa]
MATLGKSAQTLEAPPVNPNNHQIDENGRTQTKDTQKVSDYEHLREERIKENLERMQKLGIFDLSLKFKSVKPTRKNTITKTPRSLSPLPVLDPFDALPGEGSKPEVYTEEHEKLLGNTQMSWTLFVDGYGQDGRRIYDPVRGKTCHQCRQKTLGHRTHCSKCGMVQGQFCGDCLYMRYGEHVLEAQENPNWICPVCRGICNCSLCRQAKGWPPTGALYRKISQLGFKSVSHYLIQTRRQETDSDKIPSTRVPASAKRSLPFSDTDGTLEGMKSPVSNNDDSRLVTPEHEDNETDDEFKDEKRKEMDVPENKHGAMDISSGSNQDHNKKSERNSESSDQYGELSKPESEDSKTSEILYSRTGSRPKLKRKSRTPEPSADSIAGRLRQRQCRGDKQDEELVGTNESLDVKEQATKR